MAKYMMGCQMNKVQNKLYSESKKISNIKKR